MKAVIAVLLIGILAAVSVAATVIPASLTSQKCGNGKPEGYELCEPGTPFDLCPPIGKLLKIAMVCNEQTCACLPGESAKNCGNQIRESAEMCDPGTKEAPFDLCPNVSTALKVPLKCDVKTCDCVADGPPIVISYCGDSKVEGDEDCESDDDCPKGRVCGNCTCVRHESELNFTRVQHNVTTDDSVLPPSIDDITRKEGKTTLAEFVIEDYIGEVLPEDLGYFDDETINIHVAMKSGENATVGLVTTQMVVQEAHPFLLNDSTMNVWMDEDSVAALKGADERTQLIVRGLSDGTIRYRPTGFFRRIWFFFFTPY